MRLDDAADRIAIITGPNMAGKSTYMRQVALIVLMASIGSFVPASHADISICDRIFTRVGASDDLASGQSTFMVEMNEVANILRNATTKSLLILDEIGRGTSTFDGLSIAWAVVEYIAKVVRAKTLFATHYHELTELEGRLDGVNNYCIAVTNHDQDIVFLRKIIPGGADQSYGIDVASLAGVPRPVIERAKEIAAELSDADILAKARELDREPGFRQESLALEESVAATAAAGTATDGTSKAATAAADTLHVAMRRIVYRGFTTGLLSLASSRISIFSHKSSGAGVSLLASRLFNCLVQSSCFILYSFLYVR